jgi:hypothetical protein
MNLAFAISKSRSLAAATLRYFVWILTNFIPMRSFSVPRPVRRGLWLLALASLFATSAPLTKPTSKQVAQMNATITDLAILANRLFASIYADVPIDSYVTGPEKGCHRNNDFLSAVEWKNNDLVVDPTAIKKSANTPSISLKGHDALWPFLCSPVEVIVMASHGEGGRWLVTVAIIAPKLVDGAKFQKELRNIISTAEMQPKYLISIERARTIASAYATFFGLSQPRPSYSGTSFGGFPYVETQFTSNYLSILAKSVDRNRSFGNPEDFDDRKFMRLTVALQFPLNDR